MATDYANEVDAFKDSDEWFDSANPVTLRAPLDMQKYLENRLLRAFAAGWNAREKYAQSEPGDQR